LQTRRQLLSAAVLRWDWPVSRQQEFTPDSLDQENENMSLGGSAAIGFPVVDDRHVVNIRLKTGRQAEKQCQECSVENASVVAGSTDSFYG
jgi:hypothetical protein